MIGNMTESSHATAETVAVMQSRREGFSLVEVVISMVLIAVIVSSLAMLTTKTAQQSIQLQNQAGRQAYALQETNRIAAIPYDSIPNKVGCDTVATGNLQYRRCLGFTAGTRYREATMIITPLKAGTYADTIVLRRAASSTVNPLFTP